MAEALHTMGTVSRQTGLSPHVIRVWERRYGAVKPIRTPTNRRVYRDEDVQRLQLLQQVTLAGHSIGQASKLSDEQLQTLLNRESALPSPSSRLGRIPSEERGSALRSACLAAIKQMDVRSLNSAFESAALELGTQGLLTRIAGPLAQQVGELWQNGEISAAHEHFVTAALRDFLRRHSQQFLVHPNTPTLIVATPSGQIHELGAVIVSSAAMNLGWKVIYLGTSLPALEIAGAANQQEARAVALSIVYPEDDPALPGQLRQLRSYLKEDIDLIVGGRGAPAYAATLVEIRARVANELGDLFTTLETLRRTAT